MSYMDLAAALVRRLEGCRLVGYADSVGKATNGYGNRRGAKIGVSITQEIADHDLDINLADADRELRACLTAAAFGPLADHQKATLVTFVFNLGAEPDWTVWKDIDAGKLGDVPTQLRRFDHGHVDGKLVVIPGLDARREAEIVFWNTADVGQAAAMVANAPQPSSGYTRDISTPPAPLPAPPLAKASLANKVVTAAAGILTAGGTLGSQVHDIVAPHAGEARVFSALAIGATGVVVACSIIGLLIHGHQAEQRAV